MEINTILKFKFKDQEFELTLEEAKELQKELNKILAEPAPIYINNYPNYSAPYTPFQIPTYTYPWYTTCSTANVDQSCATILTGTENITYTGTK